MSYQQEMLYNMVQGLADEGPLKERLAGVAIYLGPRIMGEFEDEPTMQGNWRRFTAASHMSMAILKRR
jgi:hypothetical protein